MLTVTHHTLESTRCAADRQGKTPSAYARAFDHQSTVKLLDGIKTASSMKTAMTIAVLVAVLAVVLFYLLHSARS
jgi:hypothetical protein